MRLSVLSVLFVLMAVTQAVTLSKHGGEAHASSKHAAKKSKSKKAVSQKAPAAKKSHKDAPGAAKKGHKKNRHTTNLVQAKQHEEDFGTTGGGGEEPQQAGPAPAAPPAARPAASGGGTAAAVWSGETNRYGPCLRDFASLVSNNECAQEKLGDVEYFLNTVNQEEHTLSAGYKTGMARKGMVIEGIGMNASSSEATPLTRHAFQRSRVELAYACAPAGSECKSHMTPVNEIDSSIGKDKECPIKLMQGGGDPAMRGRFVQIVHAYSTNSEAYFWGNSREYAAAVAVCFYVRTYGNGGSNSAPPGMLLKENIYSPAPAGIVVSLEEEVGGKDIAGAGAAAFQQKHAGEKGGNHKGHGSFNEFPAWMIPGASWYEKLKTAQCNTVTRVWCVPSTRKKVFKVIKVTGGATALVLSLTGVGGIPVFAAGLMWNAAWLAFDLRERYKDGNFAKCGTGGTVLRAIMVNGVATVTGFPVEEGAEFLNFFVEGAHTAATIASQVESGEGILEDATGFRDKFCENTKFCQYLPCQDNKPHPEPNVGIDKTCAWSCVGCNGPEECGIKADNTAMNAKECFNSCKEELGNNAVGGTVVDNGGGNGKAEDVNVDNPPTDTKFYCGPGGMQTSKCE
jgi:hypothetical protein